MRVHRSSAEFAATGAEEYAWFNAGPRLLVAAMGDNADMKFVQKTPILKETHEAVGTPAEQALCVAAQNTQTMLMNMQSGQALAMGYFGGYAGREQKISQKDTERISEAFSRKIESDKGKRTSVAEKFHQCSRRILKDVESKGMIRTAVEGVNLSEHAAAKDTLMAECLRTVADVTFQVQVLLPLRLLVQLVLREQALLLLGFQQLLQLSLGTRHLVSSYFPLNFPLELPKYFLLG